MQLTTHDQKRLDILVDVVRQNEFGMLKWAKALWQIKQSDLWKSVCESWPEYCEKTFGYSRRKAYDWIAAVEFVENQKLIGSSTGEEVQIPTTVKGALALKRKAVPPAHTKIVTITDNNPTLLPMSAKHDQSGPPIQFKTPPVLPMDLASVMAAIFRDVDKLIHRSDFSYESLQILYRLAGEVKQAQHLLQGVLPGFEDVASRPKFKAPSKEEVVKYCVSVGLKASDGEYFHDTKTGCNWMNAGKKIVDWTAVVRAWKHASHFPSLKVVNGYGKTVPKEKSLLQRQTEKAIRQIEQI